MPPLRARAVAAHATAAARARRARPRSPIAQPGHAERLDAREQQHREGRAEIVEDGADRRSTPRGGADGDPDRAVSAGGSAIRHGRARAAMMEWSIEGVQRQMAGKVTDKRCSRLRSEAARRCEPATPQGASARRPPGDGRARPPRRPVGPGRRRARPAARAGRRHRRLPRRDRPARDRLPGRRHRAHPPRPRPAAANPRGRERDARGRRVLPDHRRGLLPDAAPPARDRRPRGVLDRFTPVRADDDVDHPFGPGAPAGTAAKAGGRIRTDGLLLQDQLL